MGLQSPAELAAAASEALISVAAPEAYGGKREASGAEPGVRVNARLLRRCGSRFGRAGPIGVSRIYPYSIKPSFLSRAGGKGRARRRRGRLERRDQLLRRGMEILEPIRRHHSRLTEQPEPILGPPGEDFFLFDGNQFGIGASILPKTL